MSWLSQNWLWVVLIGGFLAMHLIGHRHGGGCGGRRSGGQRGSHREADASESDSNRSPPGQSDA